MGKFTVQLSGDMDSLLDELSKQQGIPKTQVIRRSLALMKYFDDERQQGNKVAIANKDNEVVKEIVQA